MAAPAEQPGPGMPLKQKMATGFKALLGGARRLALGDDGGSDHPPAKMDELFARTDPAVDGESCLHDCDSCSAHFPRGFKIDEADLLYGYVRGWSTHVLVATGKSDWVRDVTHEKGSVMQAIGHAHGPSNGRLMLSASNMPTPHHTSDYSEPTTVLLLPAFVIIENATPASVPTIITEYIEKAPTNTSPLEPVSLPRSLPAAAAADAPEPAAKVQGLISRACPHRALILLCSQKTRDARCGQSAPVLRKELERHLRPLGLYRDLDDERPGGVGIYFISHVGGHKYSANMMVYRRPDAFGLDAVERAKLPADEVLTPRRAETNGDTDGGDGDADAAAAAQDVGAAQCIWLARVRPEDCENIVKYTVLQGKVLKPDRQLRGGFDRGKGLLSW